MTRPRFVAIVLTILASPACGRPVPSTSDQDPFAKVNAMRLHVAVLIHRADDPAGGFVEAQNSYPARAEYPVDGFAVNVAECYRERFDDIRLQPGSFGRDVGRLTIAATYDQERFARAEVVDSTFRDPKLEGCVLRALSKVTWQPGDGADPQLTPSTMVRFGVTLAYKNGYYVREAKADVVERCDRIRFRQNDPRLPNDHQVKTLRVSGIRCRSDAVDVAKRLLGEGRVLLEREPRTQRGIELSGWDEAYVRLPDGRDYGLELVRAGICDDSGESHPRQREYRAR